MIATRGILLTAIVVSLSESQSPTTYVSWLRELDSKTIYVPQSSGYENLQIPLDVTVIADTGHEQCQPTTRGNCSSINEQSINLNPSDLECSEQECFETECANTYRYIPVERYATNYNLTIEDTILVETDYPECGLNINFQTRSLTFQQPDSSKYPSCSFPSNQPTIVWHDNFNSSCTLSFTVNTTQTLKTSNWM